jgi:hypothetical protein
MHICAHLGRTMSSMYVTSLIAAVAAFALAVVWAVTGVAGLTGTLPGNRWTGVRTKATRESEQAWRLAQRVAAPGYLAGAAALVLGGLLALVYRWGFLFALGGLILGLLALSVVSGVAVRAAQAVVDANAPAGGCSSDCCSSTADDAGGATGGCAAESGAAESGAAEPGAADPHAAAAADCGETSCGSCALNGMCLPGGQTASSQADATAR